MEEHYVYALVDPINRLPFYIGKEKKDMILTFYQIFKL